MAAAELLVDQFPAVWAAQGAGRISPAHSRVIVDAGRASSHPATVRSTPRSSSRSPRRSRPTVCAPWRDEWPSVSLRRRCRRDTVEPGLNDVYG
jgi:hypothetical protein